VRSEGALPKPSLQSKIDLHAALRRDSRAGLSNQALQRKYCVDWRNALSSAWPPPRREHALLS